MVTDESSTGRSPLSTDDASGYGVTLTVVGAVLLALSYYGFLALDSGRELGEALPTPFYLLAFAVLFVVELLARGRLDLLTVARAVALAVVYGSLFILGVEGGAYILDEPEVALDGFAGVTVFAAALVLAALLYVGYLTVVNRTRNGTT
ncbi:MAG: hypothetical protein ACQETI_14970 [Halobacteriota archaeon]